ncbi:aldehyde dehydrogenase family protein [Natronomonas gomsonensis]|uniref:aldehyde dehydrogenase family protein n=1 Tax=Natronomonas gomsonensis TaxID=1046043 RepID=UPI0020CA3B8E|nr:aldehyde dehydrogenase family protein [Natronomonas gomsonensis]MCY4731569.1 aldehyde dehydrogenase family protein [Natronomonas gomsonensis]
MRDLYIDGQWCESDDCAAIEVTSPIDDAVLTTVPSGTERDVASAVAAAERASDTLADMTVGDRAEGLEAVADHLRERADELAETLAREVGKPLSEAHAEVDGGIHSARAYGEDALRLFGDVTHSSMPDRLNFTRREPYGPTGIITPWNYPFEIPMGHLCAAIAVGNPVVWKPAATTSLIGHHIAEAFAESPLPEGAFNFVTGRGSTVGSALVNHPEIRLIAFTGSTTVGQGIAASAANHSAECLLEMGGKDPVLVFDDADIEAAAEHIVFGSNYNCGQSCSGTERVLATPGIYDELVTAVAEKTAALTVGDPLDPETDVGPPINDDVRETVREQVADAVANGATVESGGEVGERYIEPTVLSGVEPSMAVAREETFGPVTPILEVSDYDEAITVANDSRYGLQSAVFTDSVDRALRAADDIEAGGVVVNGTNNAWEHQLPFGGVKESGSGGQFKGVWHLESMTTTKAIAVDYSE